jgi:YggT family protein
VEIICLAVWAYVIAIILRMVLSWFPPSDGIVADANRVLWRITEPVLGPVRRALPPLGGLDLSPLIVILVLQIVVLDLILRCGNVL